MSQFDIKSTSKNDAHSLAYRRWNTVSQERIEIWLHEFCYNTENLTCTEVEQIKLLCLAEK